MHAGRDALPVGSDTPGYLSRQAEWGDFNVAFETIAGGLDATQPFSALPDGRCQCPHWGYVIKGRLRIKYADREETISAGEAYYMEPGHVPVIEEDVELIEFSPRAQYQETMAALEGEPGEPAGDEGSSGPEIEPGDAVPDEAPPSESTGPPGEEPKRVIEEKGRDERAD